MRELNMSKTCAFLKRNKQSTSSSNGEKERSRSHRSRIFRCSAARVGKCDTISGDMRFGSERILKPRSVK